MGLTCSNNIVYIIIHISKIVDVIIHIVIVVFVQIRYSDDSIRKLNND